MAVLRITKEFKFECAHALTGYNGKCSHIHGHSYTLRVTVRGEPISNPEDPKYGLVIDFNDLKKIINTIDRNAFMVINETKYVVNGFFK